MLQTSRLGAGDCMDSTPTNNNSYIKTKILADQTHPRYVTKSEPCFLQRSDTKKEKHECPHEDIAPPDGATEKSIKCRHRALSEDTGMGQEKQERQKALPNALPW